MITKEELIYATTKIVRVKAIAKEKGIATSFFYKTPSGNYYLVSNKHFYQDTNEKDFVFRILIDKDGDYGELKLDINATPIIHNIYDIGAICINSAIEKIKSDNVKIKNKIITQEDIIPLTEENFSSIENAYVIGKWF